MSRMSTHRPAARPRLLIHIGTHKTGTSAIQSGLWAHREALRERGIVYPDTRREPWPDLPKHCSVFRAAVSGRADWADEERQWLLAQATQPGVHTVLISEEGLSEPDAALPRFFEPLREVLDIEVLCCLRRQDRFVESLYGQFTRERERREGRPLLTFVRAPGVRARLDYATWLADWQRLTPQVHVADFDALRHQDGLLAWLSRVGRLDLEGVVAPPQNRSPDLRLATLLARWNRQRLEPDLRELMRLAHAVEAQHPGDRQRHLLGRLERERLLQSLAHSNGQLATRHGLSFDAEMPDDEPLLASEAPDPDYLERLLLRACPPR